MIEENHEVAIQTKHLTSYVCGFNREPVTSLQPEV